MARWPPRSIDGAHGVEERLPGVGVGERAEAAPHLAEVGARAKADARRGGSAPRSTTLRRRDDASKGRTTSAPGSAAMRRMPWSSRPRPPLETRTSRSIISGKRYENCIATPPPSEWPTSVTRVCSSPMSRSRTSAAYAPGEYSVIGLADWPWPRRSGAMTVKCFASAGMISSHVSELQVMPCSSTSAGPLPAMR